MELTLKIGDRLAIINQILPREAGMVDMVIREGVVKKVNLTEKDIEEAHVVDLPNGSLKWDTDLPGKPFDFTDAEMALLKKHVQRADTEGKVTPLSLSVCQMIQEVKKEN